MANTGTAIEVLPSFNLLQFILFISKPKVAIDGNEQPVSWNKPQRFDVAAGKHTVQVCFSYLILPQAGKNSIDIDVPAGQTVQVRYKAPWIVFMKGSLKAGQ